MRQNKHGRTWADVVNDQIDEKVRNAAQLTFYAFVLLVGLFGIGLVFIYLVDTMTDRPEIFPVFSRCFEIHEAAGVAFKLDACTGVVQKLS